MEFERDGIKYYDEFAEYASQVAPEEWDYFELADDLSDQIFAQMKAKGISKAELAKRLGHSRAYVTKVLAGDMNITMKTLAKFLYHLEAKAKVKIVDRQSQVQWLGLVTGGAMCKKTAMDYGWTGKSSGTKRTVYQSDEFELNMPLNMAC